ncbi:MAG: beta-ketoacyl-ACP synthase II [Parvularculaceae bacterium]
MRRVVVTGLGMVSPLASGVEATWRRIVAGESGAGAIRKFDTTDFPCKIGAEVPRSNGYGGGAVAGEDAFNPDDFVSPKEQRRIEDFITFGIAAADMAVKDSGLELKAEKDRERIGVLIGSGIGGLDGIAKQTLVLKEQGVRRVSPFFITSSLINLVSGQVSIRFGMKGPNHAVVTACATGAHAIGDAARLIIYGDADVMVAGGAESAICPIGYAGFCATKALTTHFNDDPVAASRPYDRDRDGFLMGEGAGVVILEELEHAKARGAKIYGEIIGYGLSGDAHHITAPADDGSGGYRAMKMALGHANVKPSEIDYVNAHGTSTPLGDEIELRAVERLFGGEQAEGLVMSSTKSSIGHLLGAAGAVEAIFSILAIRDGVCPPTLNLENPTVETMINLAPKQAVKKTVNVALSNSFGFGGTNASLVVARYNG